MLKLKQPCMLTIVGGGLRRLNVQYVGFEGHGGLSGLEVCGELYCIPSYNLNFPALASQQQFRSSSAEWIYSEKHLNLKLMPYIWQCFVIIWDWFKISPDPTQQEPLHLPRGFVCAQSPVSRRVEFAIKWVGKLFFISSQRIVFFLPKWFSFIHHSLVVTFQYLLPRSQIMWGNRLQMRNYCRGMRRGNIC